jgi:hypothetical protein
MKNTFGFWALLLSVALFSCQQAAEKSASADGSGVQDMRAASEEAYEAPPSAEPAPPPADALPANAPRYIIHTAHLRIQVKDVKAALPRVERLIKRYGGYTGRTSFTNDAYQTSGSVVIRVPATRFDSLLNALEGEAAFVSSRTTSAEDVSEEYVDIEIRLAAKKLVRDRYVDILRNKARTVEEVLKAEEAIRVIQEEIEAKEGRLRYLKDQVAMSTVNLELYQEVAYRPEPPALRDSLWSRLGRALSGGGGLAIDFVVGLAYLWPLLLLLGVLYAYRRRLLARWRKGKD